MFAAVIQVADHGAVFGGEGLERAVDRSERFDIDAGDIEALHGGDDGMYGRLVHTNDRTYVRVRWQREHQCS